MEGTNPMQTRDWQNWDAGTVAEMIEKRWQAASEQIHRDRLVALASRYITEASMTVLEVGCGSGLIYKRLVPRIVPNSGYTGIDISANMLDIARRNFPDGRFLRGDGYRLDFADRSFDIVLCFEVLGHLPEVATFTRELLRVTRRTCLLTVWPSPIAEIVTDHEELAGVRFLHRRYPEEYIRSVLRDGASESEGRIHSVSISSAVTAFIVGPADPPLPLD